VAIADDLVVRILGIVAVPPEVLERDGQILLEDQVLPLGGEVPLLRRIEAEKRPEPIAHPLDLGMLEIPVPDPVQRAGLEEVEDRRIALDEGIELSL
jgi:hypothetical protein